MNLWLWGLLVVLSLILLGVLVGILAHAPSRDLQAAAVKFILAFIPSTVVLGLIHWLIRLNELIGEVRVIHQELDEIRQRQVFEQGNVLRLLTEYHCELVHGFPIPGFFYHRWRDELNGLYRWTPYASPSTPPSTAPTSGP